ncbi:MAG: hypothetical protein KBD52_00755 [Candidatus Pacebacteria bacterium]|nr:hypothetical protein [Candidatus Paceibacterota bacterium]
MKLRKYFYKIITFVLILSFVIPIPYLTYIKKVEAVDPTGSYNTSGAYSIGGYLKELAPALKQLPLCKGEMAGFVQGLFKKGGGLDEYQKYLLTVGKDEKAYSREEFAKAQEQAEQMSQSVNVFDNATFDVAVETRNIAKSTKVDISKIKGNDSCFKSLGRFVTKLLIQKMTYSTVEWIQGGFKGSPAFVKNTGDYFLDIAKTEILQFGTEIDNPELFPFGKAYLQNRAAYFKSNFSQNAQFSLNKVLQSSNPYNTATGFEKDFSQGGWLGWNAVTQVPANNPLGFQLMATRELDTRTESRVTNINNELNRSQGFLGDSRCVDQPGISYQEHQAALIANDKEYVTVITEVPNPNGGPPSLIPSQKATGYIIGTCKNNKWEYVTPGSLIADAATQSLRFGRDSLVKVEDLNDAVAALLDATINYFATDLIDKGLALLGTSGSSGAFNLDQNSFMAEGGYSITEDDFPPFALNSSWLQENPNFNIRTDFTQALIDDQRIYRQKLTEQTKVLTDLNTTIFQLDYCIPGPHPGYEQDSRRILSVAQNAIVSKTPADMVNINEETMLGIVKASGVIVGMVVGIAIGAGTGPLAPVAAPIGAAIGAIVGFITDITNMKPEKILALYYATIVEQLTGIKIDVTGNDKADLRNKQEVTGGLDKIYGNYMEIIRKVYNPKWLPPVAQEAAIEYRKASGNWQIIEANKEKAVTLGSVINRLGSLKQQVDNLNVEYQVPLNQVPPFTQGSEEYENKLKKIIDEFGRISGDMVTGNDIAEVDNSMKQSRDEIKHVYLDLLIGPYGCEQDIFNNPNRELELPADPDKYYLVRQTLRADYPFEIWYDYNKLLPLTQFEIPEGILPYLDQTEPLPTPNRMPPTMMKNGPGFLSTVYFNYSLFEDGAKVSCTDRPLNAYELDCIDAVEAFKEVNSWPVSVGKNSITSTSLIPYVPEPQNNKQTEVSFEQIIGVY